MNENNKTNTLLTDRKRKIRERYKGVESDKLDVIPAIPVEDVFSETAHRHVAVYARVSTDDPSQTSSYELQKNHYTDMITRYPNWQLVGIYADEGISGTSLQHRDSFIQMISDCEQGKIDLIVTKSVARFARNIVDCIGYVRKLKQMTPPIGIFFETENIHTLNPHSEMTLAFMATIAQEESHTKSEVMNSSIEMRFKRGIFLTPPLLGYDHDEDGNLIINEEEAKTVRLIFFMYLYGYSCQVIADTLTDYGRTTKKGNSKWSASTILQILQNERHCGDVLARKTYTPNFLDHKSKKNKKNRNQYRQTNHHESIVSRDDYIAVQHLIHNAKYGHKGMLPTLQVIMEGSLTGFVSINPRWAGFKAEEYIEASSSAYMNINEEYIENDEITAHRGDFDLRGYEIAHGQFFTTKGRAVVTISVKDIIFSAETVRKLGDIETVELLIHPHKMLLAVRSSKPENKQSVIWSRKKNGKSLPKIIRGKAFLPTIFKLLKWKTKCKYRLLGILHEFDNEKFIIFDLKETEIQMPHSFIANSAEDSMTPFTSSTKKQVLAYPADWSEGFGKDYYNHTKNKEIEKEILSKGNIDSQSTPYKESELKVTDQDTLDNEIQNIINEMEVITDA